MICLLYTSEGRLQLDGVVRLAVAHQAVAGGVHKERLGLGGELQAQARCV